jgi:hypothetical protein
MGQVLTSTYTAWIAVLIDARHHHADRRRGLQRRLEAAIPSDNISTFFPAYKQVVLIIDHPDFLTKKYGEKVLSETLRELGIPVLILISSWERVLDLKNECCLLLGEPGLGHWTPEELAVLWASRPALTRDVDAKKLDQVLEFGVLS